MCECGDGGLLMRGKKAVEGPFYCPVCRQTSFSGRGHVYGLKHQERLGALLGRFLQKVEEARKVLSDVKVEKYDFTQHEQNFWCYCCNGDVKKHITNGSLAVLYGGLLEHFASLEHLKQTNKFWWENKADKKLKEKFLLSGEAYEKFKTAVAKAVENYEEKEDEYIKQEAEYIREVDHRRQEVVQAAFEPQAELNSIDGCKHWESNHYDSHSLGSYNANETEPGPSGVNYTCHSGDMANGQTLTFIGNQFQISKPETGNIHTGAIPPWLIDEEDPDTAPKPIGPSYEEFIQQREREKLKKLPPNRVGANFNHLSETDDSWLPSFGRVWNDGRRWQSRHQFRLEEGKKSKKRKRVDQ
ncbi:coiled-coil domain-containing protein 84 isoform X2 [Pristis pectinata]|uniref:coiled-coil domain-containing protein 84 isoform X2 n=1 Tax=Pristis pectinata TaxID=685728 RepID=UPI00223D4ADC|nr:coiled-coil domain-containing protein 84 isoform X2 [Pristis pectinata]